MTFLAWHFVDDRRGRSPYGLPRGWYSANRSILGALATAERPILERVRVSGEVRELDGRILCRRRKAVWSIDAEGLLLEFACRRAERILHRARARDPLAWRLIAVVRAWNNGKATIRDVAAAKDFADSAARAVEDRVNRPVEPFRRAFEAAGERLLRAKGIAARALARQTMERAEARYHEASLDRRGNRGRLASVGDALRSVTRLESHWKHVRAGVSDREHLFGLPWWEEDWLDEDLLVHLVAEFRRRKPRGS